MPYKLVRYKNGENDEVVVVPEGWVVGTHLYWPHFHKKNEIESLRCDELSIPDKTWKRMKCRIKLSDITSFEEAPYLEDLYSKLQEKDEEMHFDKRQNKRKQAVDPLLNELLDVNMEFNATQYEATLEEVEVKPDISNTTSDNQVNIQVTLNDDQGTSNNDMLLSIRTSELTKIAQKNKSLQTENKALKEELLHSVEFQVETKQNFVTVQAQLDRIIDLLQNKNHGSSSYNVTNDGIGLSEDCLNENIITDIKFPIESRDQLELLEHKLIEEDVMTCLVKKFSQTCGTSGLAKISKVGLSLMRNLITDELLNQFTWKGIKGSPKTPFVQYVKIRELFYRIAHLADNSCSFSDSDTFIQQSAIKHSGQRLKRRQTMSSESKVTVKRSKNMMIPGGEIMLSSNDPSADDSYNEQSADYDSHNQLSTDDRRYENEDNK